MLPEPSNQVIHTGATVSDPKVVSEASDSNPLSYLYHCYLRLQAQPRDVSIIIMFIYNLLSHPLISK